MPLKARYCLPDGRLTIASGAPRGRFEETPGKTTEHKGKRQNWSAWCAAGASGATLIELTGDFDGKRVSRGTLKHTWGAPVAPGRPSGRFLAHMVFRAGVDA